MRNAGDEPDKTEHVEDLGNDTVVRWTHSKLRFEHTQRYAKQLRPLRLLVDCTPYAALMGGLLGLSWLGNFFGFGHIWSWDLVAIIFSFIGVAFVSLGLLGIPCQVASSLMHVRKAQLRWVGDGDDLRVRLSDSRRIYPGGPSWAMIERMEVPWRSGSGSSGYNNVQWGSGAWYLRMGEKPGVASVEINLNIAEENVGRASEIVGAFLGRDCPVIAKTEADREKERGLPRIVG